MRRPLTILLILALAACSAWLFWLPEKKEPPFISRAFVKARGLELTLSRKTEINRVSVKDSSGKPLLEQRMGGVSRQILGLYLKWPKPGQYTLQLTGPWGSLQKQVSVSKSNREPISSSLLVPYSGSISHKPGGSAAASVGGTLTCCLSVSQAKACRTRVMAKVLLGPGLELVNKKLPESAQVEKLAAGTNISFHKELSAAGQDAAFIFRVKSNTKGTRLIKAEVTSQAPGIDPVTRGHQCSLDFVSPKEMAAGLKVSGQWLPTGVEGLFDRRKQADTIYYKPPFLRTLARWLGSADDRMSYWMPYTYQSLGLINTSEREMSFLIKARVLENKRDTTPQAFQPPDVFSGGLSDHAVAAAINLAPGQEQRVVLPIFITAPPRQGNYRRRIAVYPLGGQEPLKTLEYSLHVTGLNYTALAFTLGSLFVSLAALAVLAWRFNSLLTGFKVRQVVIIALFGALTFTGVNLPLRIFGSLFYGLLGPFSVLLVGFFSEILYYSLLVALIRTIPRPGVASLLTLIRYLLAVLITGGFHISDFLYVGTSMAVKESALYLAGVTRPESGFNWSWPKVGLLALILASGNALLSASGLYVHMVLLRLYFADWFVAVNVLVNGLLYTMIGVCIGKSFSDHLVWTEE